MKKLLIIGALVLNSLSVYSAWVITPQNVDNTIRDSTIPLKKLSTSDGNGNTCSATIQDDPFTVNGSMIIGKATENPAITGVPGLQIRGGTDVNTLIYLLQPSTAAIAVVNDANTLLSNLAIDGATLALNANGGGKVGIGASNPAYALDVIGATQRSGQDIVGGTLTVVGNSFSIGTSTLAASSGKVGIGTSNPLTKLVMSSGVFTLDGNASGISVKQVGGTTDPFIVGTSTLIVKNSGNVGIGTSNPQSKLEVSVANQNNNTATGIFINDPSNTGADAMGLWFSDGAETTKAEIYTSLHSGSGEGDIHFMTGNGVLTNKVFINGPDGNVGIGTTNPRTLLEVPGTSSTTALFVGGVITVGNDNYQGGGTIQMDNSYGITTIGTIVHLLPTNNTNFTGDVFLGDAVGHGMDDSITPQQFNTFLGEYVVRNATNTGSYGTMVGAQVGDNWNNVGNSNALLGYRALYGPATGGTMGSGNTAIGYQAGYQATGSGNIFIGSNSGTSSTSSGTLWVSTGTNLPLIFGNFTSGRVGIGNSAPASTLDVSGALSVGGVAFSSNSVSAALSGTFTTATLGPCIASSSVTLTTPTGVTKVQLKFTGALSDGNLAAVMIAGALVDGGFYTGETTAKGFQAGGEAVIGSLANLSFNRTITGLSAATHTFCLTLAVSAGTGTIDSTTSDARFEAMMVP